MFQTKLEINGDTVEGSGFEFEAHAMPITCKPVKNSDEIGPGVPCVLLFLSSPPRSYPNSFRLLSCFAHLLSPHSQFITFALENAKPKRLKAVIRGDDGKLGTDVTTKKNSDGTWDVNFTPPNSNSFTVELTADRVAVENKLTIQLV